MLFKNSEGIILVQMNQYTLIDSHFAMLENSVGDDFEKFMA